MFDALSLEDNGSDVFTGIEARLSPLATCQQHDVVRILDGDGLRAARIKLHCSLVGECVSMVQTFTLHRRVPNTALAVWRVNEEAHECWETSAILASVPYCVYPDDTVGTLLPDEFT